ncbi:MAG: hypothetical protein JSV42_04405 [Chloroflexota bacterium]|nr:MAG: hypothetical protein JSV42_04405 [Chloroflexota bacterium]
MSIPLVETKLRIPPVRENRVKRQRLIDYLNAGLNRKLSLISSPAGFGKTTLMGEFVAVCDRPVAWFSIDDEDNDTTRFFAYLIAALSNVKSGFGETVQPVIQTPKPERMRPLLTVLINEIAADFPPFILALDDYHLVSLPAIHEILTFIIDHQPGQMHLMIATRADPPFSLSRLRAQNQLIEIREMDLRFTTSETAEFLTRVMGIELRVEDQVAMEERTEGWAAGLQLAALSLLEQPDKECFIRSFAGSDRYILDYLGEEVLNNQDQRVKDFLLQTSILERLCASLCDLVTASDNSQAILQKLENNHLFIIPLDRDRTWYRYHRLFKDFLVKTLQLSNHTGMKILHSRASQWFEGHGYMDEAIDHAISAEEYQRAMELIAREAQPRLMRSETSSLIRWIDSLPEDVLATRPSLYLIQAWALVLQGSPEENIESRLDQVEQGQVDDKALGSVFALRAFLASMKGEAKKSMELSQQSLKLLPEDDLFMRSLVFDNLGMVYLLMGDFNSSIDTFSQAAKISREAGNLMIAVGALCNLAGLWMLQGQLRRAWSANIQALDLATDARGRRLPVAGKALLGLGEIAREWNSLDEAENYYKEGIEQFKLFGELGSIISYVSLARIKEIQGDIISAQEIVDQARQMAVEFSASTMDDELVDAYQAQLWILQGENELVNRWLTENKVEQLIFDGNETVRFNPIWEVRGQILARIYLNRREFDRALQVVENLLGVVKVGQRVRSIIRLLALQAVITYRMGEIEAAVDILEQALDMAKDEGYVRTFLDEGEPMIELLYEASSRKIYPQYIGKLLAAYRSFEPASQSIEKREKGIPEVIEPLSAREVEVLELIADGLSNKEIASQLHVSLSTVKGHNRNIFGKLLVNNRTQAVAKGRALGIIPS